MRGKFQITGWDETAYYENDDGSKQCLAKITQAYSGDISGTSELQYLMSYQSSGIALFVGFEQVNATINTKSGSFVLQHNGKFESGVASSDFIIVPQSGRGDLEGINGAGSFKSTENGQANYELTIKS